ncbi:MAG: hypothetical protein ACJA1A_000927 [Saprospiraceae bacterium]|jgi:hypothetical protein
MISQYIQLQRATHREKEIVLFKFWNREDWKKSIKKLPLAKFSRTLSAYYIPYTSAAYASFKKINIPHKYPLQSDTTESLPSDREIVNIEPNRSSNVKPLLGNDVGDASISDSRKNELEISWNTKGFSIQILYNNDDISFIRKLEKSWWNSKVQLWYSKSTIHNLDAIQKRWSYFDQQTYARLYETIRNLEEPMLLEVYTSPEYIGSVLFKLKGYKSSNGLIKSLSKRQYDKGYKRWIEPYNEEMVKDIIASYKAKGYMIINNMSSAHQNGPSPEDKKMRSLKVLLSKIDAVKRPFFEEYANVFLRLGKSSNTAKPYILVLLKIVGYYMVDDMDKLDEVKINAYLSMVAGAVCRTVV